MTPERWHRITEVFHAALAQRRDDRVALLDEACAGDATLREEVDALLAAHSRAPSFSDGILAAEGRPAPLLAGAALGPYRLEALIGSGGMGEVYRARDDRLHRTVAVKVLRPGTFDHPDRRARFEREARAASALTHRNIVTVHDIGEAGGVLYIVMELVQGQTLRDLLADGPLETRRLLDIAVQVAEGLAAAHEAGVVHRDLKPENLMVGSDSVVKILDFGLAKQVPGADPDGAATGPLQFETRTGTVMGTIGYMSPEQATGRTVDFRSDHFSLGSILYELATGRHAFRRASQAESLSALLRDDPDPIERLNPGVPEPLRRVIGRCLRKEARDRHRSTRDLARELHAVRPGLDEAAGGQRRAGVLLVPAALVALAGLGIWRARATPPASGAVPPVTASPATGRGSIAVLPFQSGAAGPEDDYFADGTTDAIISALARTSGLTVIARSSTAHYKGADPQRVHLELGARYVLEGSVQRAGGGLRVDARLVDAESGAHVWGRRYEGTVEEVFVVQDAVAGDVTTALNAASNGPGHAGARFAPTRNMAAYDAYLRGRYLLAKDGDDRRGIDMLEQATAGDPGFAAAQAALAVAYAGRFWYDHDPAWEEKAGVQVQKALALAPDAADDAYLARALLAWNLPRRFPHEPTIRDLRRALQINPGNADASFLLGLVYLHVGLLDEARQAFRRTIELNPYKEWRPGAARGTAVQKFIAWTFLLEHRYDSVLEEYQRTSSAPAMSLPVDLTALIHLGRGQEVLPQIEKVLATVERQAGSGRPTAVRGENRSSAFALRAILHARAGEREKAERDIADAVRLGEGRNHFHHTQYFIASAFALLGRKDEALQGVERTVSEGFPCYPTFQKDPHFDSLRGDADFQAFLQKLESRWTGYRALAAQAPDRP